MGPRTRRRASTINQMGRRTAAVHVFFFSSRPCPAGADASLTTNPCRELPVRRFCDCPARPPRTKMVERRSLGRLEWGGAHLHLPPISPFAFPWPLAPRRNQPRIASCSACEGLHARGARKKEK